jgi:ABC-type phosphate/phosphonate transport system permease subunit
MLVFAVVVPFVVTMLTYEQHHLLPTYLISKAHISAIRAFPQSDREL